MSKMTPERKRQAEEAAQKKAAQKGILNPYNPESRHSYDCYKEGFHDAVQWADSTPSPSEHGDKELVHKHENFGEKIRRENESIRALLERAELFVKSSKNCGENCFSANTNKEDKWLYDYERLKKQRRE